jgi:hypothetical protein
MMQNFIVLKNQGPEVNEINYLDICRLDFELVMAGGEAAIGLAEEWVAG